MTAPVMVHGPEMSTEHAFYYMGGNDGRFN